MAQREIASGFIYPQTGISGTNYYGRNIQEPFRIVKGVKTEIQFFIKQANGKAIKLRNKIIDGVVFKVTDNDIIISKRLKIIDEDRGIAMLTFNTVDVLPVSPGYYKMSLTVTDVDNQLIPIYLNETYEEQYVLEIIENHITASPNTVVIDNFSSNNNLLYSDQILSTAQSISTFGVSTIAIYGNNFTGNVKVQATLETVPNISSWFDVDIDRVTGVKNYENFTGIDAYVFEGKFYWIRFVIEQTTGNIDKILYSC